MIVCFIRLTDIPRRCLPSVTVHQAPFHVLESVLLPLKNSFSQPKSCTVPVGQQGHMNFGHTKPHPSRSLAIVVLPDSCVTDQVRSTFREHESGFFMGATLGFSSYLSCVTALKCLTVAAIFCPSRTPKESVICRKCSGNGRAASSLSERKSS